MKDWDFSKFIIEWQLSKIKIYEKHWNKVINAVKLLNVLKIIKSKILGAVLL